MSVVAQLGTAPLVMYYFSGFSLYFLLAKSAGGTIDSCYYLSGIVAFVFAPVAELHHCILFMLEEALNV